jgi:peptidoglycan hydrolase CwlO-like protein
MISNIVTVVIFSFLVISSILLYKSFKKMLSTMDRIDAMLDELDSNLQDNIEVFEEINKIYKF